MQLFFKLGFSGTETHFPALWNYIEHMSQSRSHLDGEVGRKMVLEKLRMSYFVPIDPQASLYLWALLGHGSPGPLCPVHKVIRS